MGSFFFFFFFWRSPAISLGEIFVNGVRTHVNSKGKIPSAGLSPEEDRTRDTVDSEPKHYQRAIPAPEHGF